MRRSAWTTTVAMGLGLILIAALPAAAVQGSGITQPEIVVTGDVVSGVSKLYVQQSRTATAERIRGMRYEVKLRGVDPTTLWFADRPDRSAGSQSTRSFINTWASLGFASDPPNAVIQFGENEGIAVELKKPRYNATKRVLRYTAVVIDQQTPRLPEKFANVSVFIDDAGLEYQTGTFEISNWTPGQQVSINLTQAQGTVAFSSGQFPTVSGIVIIGEDGPIPLTEFRMTEDSLILQSSASESAEAIDAQVTLSLSAESDIQSFYLSSASDPGVGISFALGNSQPQVVNNSLTLFAWDSN